MSKVRITLVRLRAQTQMSPDTRSTGPTDGGGRRAGGRGRLSCRAGAVSVTCQALFGETAACRRAPRFAQGPGRADATGAFVMPNSPPFN
ncbi:hypothetical protein SKAU_G00226210 [Synaphobranchus kaupii]|uniref:Uncharacterized protein n=1 Tax=Synaphobranchus kaupii TaxID=118154 RepID=A0A9Q1IRX5_SYNKA|nr:hypothetical protein SKAU_G00226210 [Synaphobranchus kaupii]